MTQGVLPSSPSLIHPTKPRSGMFKVSPSSSPSYRPSSGVTVQQRRTRKQRQVLAYLIYHLTEFAVDASASNIPSEVLYTLLAQSNQPRDSAMVREARWIFERKVTAGTIVLRHQDPVKVLLGHYEVLSESQKTQFRQAILTLPGKETSHGLSVSTPATPGSD